MTQKGEHSWDLIIDYHLCPKCGYIIESRNAYEVKDGKLQKSVSCGRCGHRFVDSKKFVKRFAPLFGSPQPPEMTWD